MYQTRNTSAGLRASTAALLDCWLLLLLLLLLLPRLNSLLFVDASTK
jgi:hypothetical protein